MTRVGGLCFRYRHISAPLDGVPSRIRRQDASDLTIDIISRTTGTKNHGERDV